MPHTFVWCPLSKGAPDKSGGHRKNFFRRFTPDIVPVPSHFNCFRRLCCSLPVFLDGPLLAAGAATQIVSALVAERQPCYRHQKLPSHCCQSEYVRIVDTTAGCHIRRRTRPSFIGFHQSVVRRHTNTCNKQQRPNMNYAAIGADHMWVQGPDPTKI